MTNDEIRKNDEARIPKDRGWARYVHKVICARSDNRSPNSDVRGQVAFGNSDFALLSSLVIGHSTFLSGSIHGKVKDVEIARVTGGAGGVFRLERLAQNERNHLFVSPAVRAQTAFQRL